jgi:hypothetical protein
MAYSEETTVATTRGLAMGFIDVDSHVLEVPETWDYLDPKDESP